MGTCLSPPPPSVAAVDPDATGFPLLSLPAVGLQCHLFPVTKYQFEFFLGGTPGAARHPAYDEMQAKSRRVGWRGLTGWPGGVFAVGARLDDAVRFADWLGGGFRLPTGDEWRAIDAALTAAPPPALVSGIAPPAFHPAAQALAAWALADGRGTTWRLLGLFENAFLEWVTTLEPRGGLQGRPRPEFARGMVQNPPVHPPQRALSDARQSGVAFRLVRRLPRGAAP